MSRSMKIRPLEPADYDEWSRMRLTLWPDQEPADLRREMKEILADPRQPVFVAERSDGRLGGFLEASIHIDTYGCDTKPVGYIEGWYVDADLRRTGVGGELMAAAETWAAAQGYQEMASDCEIDNLISLQAHQALGYEEVERLIHFRKWIR